MKKNLTFNFYCILMLLALTATGIAACKKEAGEQGPKGEQGIPGPSGSTVLSGNGNPIPTLGSLGDFYLDLATSNFYGPKKAEGWGNPFSMKGETGNTGATGAAGSNGAAGSQILTGTVTPAADLGVIGDYYLDKNTYNLYGPKTASGWGVALPLKGTANVIYSGWNYAKNFRDTTIDNSALRIGDLSAPSLTNALLNNASIQVYFTFGGGVFPLPYTSYAGGKVNSINFFPRIGRFTFTRFTHDNTNSIALSTLLQYRYVIIPGGTAVAQTKEQRPDLNDYEAVKKFYNLGN